MTIRKSIWARWKASLSATPMSHESDAIVNKIDGYINARLDEVSRAQHNVFDPRRYYDRPLPDPQAHEIDLRNGVAVERPRSTRTSHYADDDDTASVLGFPAAPVASVKIAAMSAPAGSPMTMALEDELVIPRSLKQSTVVHLHPTPVSTPVPLSSLSDHLWHEGFIRGVGSDIAIKILEKTYALHRVVLARSETLSSLMRQVGGDQVDVVINHPLLSTASVDLVLGWLYGQQITSEELATINNASVLAAAWLLGVTDLAQLCVQTALTVHLNPHRHRSRTEKTPTPTKTLLAYMQLIDATTVECAFIDAIEDALTNYLCLEGYESLQDAFAKMPIAWLERILEADAFWCSGEFDRYQFAKRVIAKRRKNVGEEEAHRLIFSYSVIYTHMTAEELETVRKDGLVPQDIFLKAQDQRQRQRAQIENVSDVTPHGSSAPRSSSMKRYTVRKEGSQRIAPLRIGVEMRGVAGLENDQRVYSRVFFYGGSWWSAFMQHFPGVDGPDKPDKWGMFLRRSEEAPEGVEAEYQDQRPAVDVVFKLFNPAVKCNLPVFESSPNPYAITQSWGYRSREQIYSSKDRDAGVDAVRLTFVLHLK